MHTTGVIFLGRDRSCIKLQLISREMFRAPSESKRGYTIPPPRAEIRSARLVIDLFDMPVDKRKAEPIVSTPLFAQSYLVETEGEGERSGGL